jgi:hypothetical protein
MGWRSGQGPAYPRARVSHIAVAYTLIGDRKLRKDLV